MGWLEAKGGVQVVFEIAQSFTWLSVNQVEAEIFESRDSNDLQRFHRFIGGMNPPEQLEQVRLERLYAETDAIHSASAVADEVCTVRGYGGGSYSSFGVRRA